MNIARPKLATVALLLTPTLCLAWGADGRRIVGEIASHYLSPEAKAAVKDRLSDQTLAEASTWADEIKSDRKWDWAKPLHYANVKPGADSFDLDRDCPEVGCVVSAVDRYGKVLRDPNATKPRKVEALKFLVHFVGDLHQSLHVSRAKDRGGNDIRIDFFGDNTNLHKVWDSGLIRHTRKSWRAYVTELVGGTKAELGDQILLPRGPLRPSEWATESNRLARSHAHDVPKDGEAYFEMNIPIVEHPVWLAGVRLAALWEEGLGARRRP